MDGGEVYVGVKPVSAFLTDVAQRLLNAGCDGDALILQVEPDGPICHTGESNCFFTPIDEFPEFYRDETGPGVLEDLFALIQDRKREMPEGSYTTSLFQGGPDRIAQKVIEEAGETALAGAKGDGEQVAEEMADLLYHALVLLSASGARPEDVWEVLRDRAG